MTREDAGRLLFLAREAKLTGPEAPHWVERLQAELEALPEAAAWLRVNGDPDGAAELGASLWRLWLVSDDVAGGRAFLALALDGEAAPPTRARALALYGDGLLAFRTGAMDDSLARNEDALAVAREVGDAEAESLALVGLSRVAFRAGDYGRVCALAAQARELVRDLDPAADAAPLHMLAAGTRLGGDYDEAVVLYTESLEQARNRGDARSVTMEHHNLGHVELHRGNLDAAARHFAERERLRNAGDPYERAMDDLNDAALADAQGDHERAAALLEQAESKLAEAGIVLDPDDASELDRLRERP